MKVNTLDYTLGNKKLPRTTIIINMSDATACPSDVAGICEFGHINGNNKCYAYKAERMYPMCHPYRTRQREYWLSNTAEQIASDIKGVKARHKQTSINAVRFNESGDFHTAECVEKLFEIARLVPELKFYTYTHRKDLMENIKAEELPKNLRIVLSYLHDKPKFSTFCLDTTLGEKAHMTCPGSCKTCSICMNAKGMNIAVSLH